MADFSPKMQVSNPDDIRLEQSIIAVKVEQAQNIINNNINNNNNNTNSEGKGKNFPKFYCHDHFSVSI